MVDVREFWLENQSGDIWEFTNEESNTFLESPTGLGMSNEYGGFRLGNAEIVNVIQNTLMDINGTLNFFGEDRKEIYLNYFNFLDFIANNSLLKLHYRTPNTFESFYRYCFVKKIDKSEIERDLLVLKCPITFATQTFWRNDKVNTFVGNNELTQKSKEYLLQRPYAYSSNNLSDMVLNNSGNTETPVKITIDGRSINPTIYFYKSNNRYGAIRLLGEFDKVIIDSDDLNQNIQLYKDGAWLTAPYSYQDLNIGSPNEVNVTFIKLKPGSSSATFNSDGIFDGNVIFEWSDEYVSI